MKGRFLAAFLAFTGVACAQTSRGTVTGTVLDSSGAVIAQAHATLTSEQTGVRLTTDSNDTGIYRFDAVDLGIYDLTVERAGFKTVLVSRIGVDANRTTTVDARLEVGAAETRIEVKGEWSELLIKDSPLRGGNFGTREARDLPLISLNPLSLARILPGATEASGSTIWGGGYTNGGGASASAISNFNGAGFSINGQRPRGNNYLLDGTENNEIYLSGEEQVFVIADAVEEVSVQTGNFGAEFGRAGGGVFNVVTRSGTNDLHGTLLWRYQSQRFDSVSNLEKLNGIPQSVFSRNVFGFTAGGPVRKSKTFFFAAFQQDDQHTTVNHPIIIPTADTVTRLRSLFPGNPRLNLYLSTLGNLRGSGAPFNLALGIDPQTGVDRGSAAFATAAYVLPGINSGPQWLARIDHYQSERHRLSWRYTYDSRHDFPQAAPFHGFAQEDAFSHHNFLFADSYTLGPSYTNEFRFSYTRPNVSLNTIWPGSLPVASTLPQIVIQSISSPGFAGGNEFHDANNLLFQETQTKLSGRHALRYGVEFLQQFVTAQSAATKGSIGYTNSPGYSAFANFLDDFSGPSASITIVFGAPIFRPDQLHQAYFFQDNWKPTPSVALTMGLRYENFGQYANALAYPAFAGFEPNQFLVRHEVRPENKDFGPAFGLAWSPHGRVFGEGKTVLRGGYQLSYDYLPTQMALLGPASSDPNAITNVITAPNSGRGFANWLERLPTSAGAPSLMDAQMVLDGNLRNPYTERWSFGVQRQLAGAMALEVSYVGAESHRLTDRADWNPRLPAGTLRIHPDYGQVWVKTSEGNSSYHALQARLDRRFSRGFQISASYTWSKMIDSTSDGVASVNATEPSNTNLTSVPVMYGGMKLDRAVSEFDRPQRLAIAYLWALPGPHKHWPRYILGDWQLAGITIFQSGTPFTVGNGFDRNNYADRQDRPDIGNPKAPLNARAIVFPACPTGYRNPDTSACVTPSDVHWVEGIGFPNGSTVGRNTLRTGGTNNFDLNLTKSIPFGETRRLELRWEALNAFNHPQYVNAPLRSVFNTVPGQFLNRDLTNSRIRRMWVQVKLAF